MTHQGYTPAGEEVHQIIVTKGKGRYGRGRA